MILANIVATKEVLPPPGKQANEFLASRKEPIGTERREQDTKEEKAVFKHFGLANGQRAALSLILALAIIAFGGLKLEAKDTAVTGVVRNASGQPVAGALVKVKSADSRLTFMVVSRAQGRYTTPNLLPGKYTVQGFGGEYQSNALGTIEVTSGQQGKIDLVLNTLQKVYPLRKKMTDADYEALMPEGDGKRLVQTRCEICHSPGNFVARRKTGKDWKDTVVKMRYRLEENSDILKEYNEKTGLNVALFSEQEMEGMANYLAKNFGVDKPPLFNPPKPDEFLPRTLLKGAEAKYFAMELNLGSSTLVGAYEVDSQGVVWVSEKKSGILGRLDAQSLAYTRVATPPVNVTQDIFATVAVDPRGHVWYTANVIPNAQWFEYDPKSKQIINTYDVPVPTTPGGDIFYNTLRFHPNGSIWSTQTAYHRLVKLDPSTRKVTKWRLREGQHPFGIAIGGDKMIWYAGDADNIVVKVDVSTGQMTPYKIPTPKSGARRMTADAEGNLWVATTNNGKLLKVDYRTGNITEYNAPVAGAGTGIDVDTKRNLIWFGENDVVKIGRFDPRTNTFLEFPLTSGDAPPWKIQVDPTNLNRVWWNSRSGRIGYIELID